MWGPSSPENVLPSGKLNSSISTCGNKGECGLLGEIFPEVRKTENLLEENIILHSSLWPLVELVHDVSARSHMLDRSQLKESNNWINHLSDSLTQKILVDIAYIPLFQFNHGELYVGGFQIGTI